MQAQHLGADCVGDVHGPRIGRHQQVGAGQQGRQLLERVAADQVQCRRMHRGQDRVGGVPFQLAAAAAQHHPPATGGGMVGNRRVAVGMPVAACVAGAGRDHQHRAAVVVPLRARPVVGLGRRGQVPAHRGLLQSQRLAEAADGVEHMDAGAVGDALVDEQPVHVLGARAVVADAAPGGDEGRQHVGAEGDLHLQQRGEAGRGQFAPQRAHAGQPGLLVVDVEHDAGQPLEQAVPGLVDHPVQLDARPGLLQRAHQRDHVGHIPECGQAQEAHWGGR